MTFSIVARVHDAHAVAVANTFIAATSMATAARPGVAAVATATATMSYATDGLTMLAASMNAANTVAELTSWDEGRDHHRLAVVCATDQASFTGSSCMECVGGRHGGDKTAATRSRATSWSVSRSSETWNEHGSTTSVCGWTHD